MCREPIGYFVSLKAQHRGGIHYTHLDVSGSILRATENFSSEYFGFEIGAGLRQLTALTPPPLF